MPGNLSSGCLVVWGVDIGVGSPSVSGRSDDVTLHLSHHHRNEPIEVIHQISVRSGGQCPLNLSLRCAACRFADISLLLPHVMAKSLKIIDSLASIRVMSLVPISSPTKVLTPVLTLLYRIGTTCVGPSTKLWR